MRFLLFALATSLLAVGAYTLYQTPKVRALFEPASPKEDPLEFLRDLPEPKPRVAPKKKTSSPGTAPATPAPAETAASEVPQNQVPNEEVSRVLIQILKAKGLADGISIGVSDMEVQVFGKVDSQQQLNEIIDVLNKGRESRRVNVEAVTISGE